jgi:hypothetical protein
VRLFNFQLRARGVICREADNECDLPEKCSGESGACPPDVHKKNGQPCGTNTGYCFSGNCPTLSIQCEQIWGNGGIAADKQCYDQFNSKGSINGHCGLDASNNYIKCDSEYVYYLKRTRITLSNLLIVSETSDVDPFSVSSVTGIRSSLG